MPALLQEIRALMAAPPERPGDDGSLTSDWLPGIILALLIVALWAFWHFSRTRSRS